MPTSPRSTAATARASAVPIWEEIHAAFAIDLTIDDMIVDGDRVAVRYIDRKLSRASCIHAAGNTPARTVSTADTTIDVSK